MFPWLLTKKWVTANEWGARRESTSSRTPPDGIVGARRVANLRAPHQGIGTVSERNNAPWSSRYSASFQSPLTSLRVGIAAGDVVYSLGPRTGHFASQSSRPFSLVGFGESAAIARALHIAPPMQRQLINAPGGLVGACG